MALSIQLLLELFIFIFCSAVEIIGLANVLSKGGDGKLPISEFRISS